MLRDFVSPQAIPLLEDIVVNEKDGSTLDVANAFRCAGDLLIRRPREAPNAA